MAYKPGIYDGIRSEDYHADPALGSTSLKTLALRTPAHYQHERKHPKTSDAFSLGTAAHSLILEDDISGIRVVPADNWLTKDAKAAKAEALATGKQPLLAKEMAQVFAMRDAVMAHPLARTMFTDHRAEASVFWDEGGQMFKARPDAWKPGVVGDLKTTITADPSEFGRRAYDLGYFISAAHYIDGIKATTGDDVAFCFVNVEKAAPYMVSVVELDTEAISYGRSMLERAKRIHATCTASGEWPGYQPFTTASLPTYATYQLEDLISNE